jgi:hypothetical protein
MKAAPSIILCFALLALAGASPGAGADLRPTSLSFGEDRLDVREIVVAGEQYDLVTMTGLGLTREAGLPCLPVKTVSFYIPEGKTVKQIRLESLETRMLPGS